MRLVLVLYLAFLIYAFRKESLFWAEKFWIPCLEVPRRLIYVYWHVYSLCFSDLLQTGRQHCK
jgi:hypothetical protein